MKYRIEYTIEARQDLRDIYAYIAEELSVPETAAGQVNRIMNAVDKLDEMPFKYPIYKHMPWESKGLRFIPVDNYMVFYYPVEADKSVYVIRIMYGGRDIEKQLIETVKL